MIPNRNLAAVLRTQIRRLRVTELCILMRQRLHMAPSADLIRNSVEAQIAIVKIENVLRSRPGGLMMILSAHSNPWWV